MTGSVAPKAARLGVFAMSEFKEADRSDIAVATSLASVVAGSETVVVAITEPATVLTEHVSSESSVLSIAFTLFREVRILDVAAVHRSVLNLSVTCEMSMSVNFTVAMITGAMTSEGISGTSPPVGGAVSGVPYVPAGGDSFGGVLGAGVMDGPGTGSTGGALSLAGGGLGSDISGGGEGGVGGGGGAGGGDGGEAQSCAAGVFNKLFCDGTLVTVWSTTISTGSCKN